MRKLFSNGLAVFAGVVSLPAPGTQAASAPQPAAEHRHEPKDSRLTCLRAFFSQGHCPAAELSSVFLEASDTYGLDWRLLPSLSFLETTGGKWAPHNNLFGWDSGRAVFSSAAESIRSVAHALAKSALYKGRDVDGILKLYNQNDAAYARRVKEVMRRIAIQ